MLHLGRNGQLLNILFRFAILHHHCAHCAPRRKARRLWGGFGREICRSVLYLYYHILFVRSWAYLASRYRTAVREIEHTPTQTGDLPIPDCVITKAGQLSPGEDDGANAPKDVQTPGDKYEDYPEDEDKIDVNSMDVVINAAKDIREGGNVFFKAGKYGEALRQYKSKHCLRAVTRQATNSMAIHREPQVP